MQSRVDSEVFFTGVYTYEKKYLNLNFFNYKHHFCLLFQIETHEY